MSSTQVRLLKALIFLVASTSVAVLAENATPRVTSSPRDVAPAPASTILATHGPIGGG